MRYAGMPFGMWVLFSGSFQKQLTAVLGYDAATAKAITKKAKPQYRQIARELPQGKKQYFGLFTLSNLIFLAILLGVWFLLR